MHCGGRGHLSPDCGPWTWAVICSCCGYASVTWAGLCRVEQGLGTAKMSLAAFSAECVCGHHHGALKQQHRDAGCCVPQTALILQVVTDTQVPEMLGFLVRLKATGLEFVANITSQNVSLRAGHAAHDLLGADHPRTMGSSCLLGGQCHPRVSWSHELLVLRRAQERS